MFQKFVDTFNYNEQKVQVHEEKQQEQTQIQKFKIVTQNDIDFQNMLIDEREKEIKSISKQMLEVNSIMKSVAELVDEQGEVVDTIRNNISGSNADVKSGKKNLEEAEESQKTGTKIAIGVLIATVISVLSGGLIVIAV